jgi:hypothetical protein
MVTVKQNMRAKHSGRASRYIIGKDIQKTCETTGRGDILGTVVCRGRVILCSNTSYCSALYKSSSIHPGERV